MEKTKKRIITLAKILDVICNIASVFIIVFITFMVLFMIGSVFSKEVLDSTLETMNEVEFLKNAVEDAVEDMSDLAKAEIYTFVYILYFLVWLLLLRFMRGLIRTMKEGSTPFTIEASKKLKFAAYVSLMLVFLDPLIALVMFLVFRLFSALFEYGAYLQDKADRTSRIQEEMIVSFAEITENKSSQTGNHVKRVSEYSKILAKQMGLSEDECEKIRLASTMHDIGKLLISAQILEKPARLTDEEFAEIKKHSGYGGELLESVEGDIMELARIIALDHHERPDGRGYPDGKTGDEISLEGRIVAVADVYDALTSRRSYKDAWDPHIAYDEIIKNAGTQFDKDVVEAFKASYGEIEKTRQSYSDASKLTFKHNKKLEEKKIEAEEK